MNKTYKGVTEGPAKIAPKNYNNNNNTSYIAHLSITMISALRIKNIDKIKTKK